jgi:hypothetical protein
MKEQIKGGKGLTKVRFKEAFLTKWFSKGIITTILIFPDFQQSYFW